MLNTVLVSLLVVLCFAALMAIGQFFGRAPVRPKCNPEDCCMQGENCTRIEEKGGRNG